MGLQRYYVDDCKSLAKITDKEHSPDPVGPVFKNKLGYTVEVMRIDDTHVTYFRLKTTVAG
jgi:hypothetical protein